MTSSDGPRGPGAEPATHEAYDVVVIGGGVGGLTAGALTAHAGRSVLVVEADGRPGGYARAVHTDAYLCDRADNLVTSCRPDGPFGQGVLDAVLRELGVRERCEFLPVDPFYVARFPDFELEVPCGREAYLEAHTSRFPAEAAGLRRLAELCHEMFREHIAYPM